MFVLNLFVSNLLMSSEGIPLYFVPAFLTYPVNDVICPLFTVYLVIVLIFLNHYTLIVHFTKYGAIFTVRNTCIVLSVTWLFPIFSTSLPLTKAGGYFKLVQRTFDCTVLNNEDSYGIYILISTFFLCFPPFSYCYIGIARQAILSKQLKRKVPCGL